MKLLLENWKSYIKEEQQKDYEKSYFGSNLNELGNKIYEAYLKFKNNSDVFKQMFEYIDDPSIKFAGAGSFRIVFLYGDNIVVKVAKTNSGKKMNKQDADFGKTGKYSNLFPKVFASEKNYEWIVVEQCETIVDYGRFLQFFENKYVDEITKGTSIYNKFAIFQNMLEYQSSILKGDEGAAEYALYRIATLDHWPFIKKLRKKPKEQKEVFDKILMNYKPIFQHLANVVAELGIGSLEVKPHNTGVAPDGRFVLIDSSVQETIDFAPYEDEIEFSSDDSYDEDY